MDKPKLAQCTPDGVTKALKKLGGLKIEEGKKHTKITHIKTGKCSTIPRHGTVNRNLMKDFVEDFLVKELGYTEKEIYKYLWC